MGWSLEGRRLVTANSDGNLTAWSGLDFGHMQTLTGHSVGGKGIPIHALAWLKDGTSFITGDTEGRLQVTVGGA